MGPTAGRPRSGLRGRAAVLHPVAMRIGPHTFPGRYFFYQDTSHHVLPRLAPMDAATVGSALTISGRSGCMNGSAPVKVSGWTCHHTT